MLHCLSFSSRSKVHAKGLANIPLEHRLNIGNIMPDNHSMVVVSDISKMGHSMTCVKPKILTLEKTGQAASPQSCIIRAAIYSINANLSWLVDGF